MPDEDDILAFLDEGDKEFLETSPAGLHAEVSATQYSVAIPEADAEIVTEKDKWEHLLNVVHRRGCARVQNEDGVIIFWVYAHDGVDLATVLKSLEEELDDLTGRKMQEAGAEAWGMF